MKPAPEAQAIDAPAVLAATSMCPDRKVWFPESSDRSVWKCSCCRDRVHWNELCYVSPFPAGWDKV